MQKIKMAVATVIVTALLFINAVQASTIAGEKTAVYVESEVQFADLAVSNENNMLMIPAKELAESLDGSFTYNDGSMSGKLSYGENELVFRLDNSIVKHNGKYFNAPAPMKISSFRFMVPAIFCYEKLGVEVYKHYTKNRLMIYKPETEKLTYEVMPGDTLWIISKTFNTTINSIKAINGLNSDTINVGQKLVIKNMQINKAVFTGFTSGSATLSSGTSLSVSAVGYLKAWTEVSITGKIGSWYRAQTPKGEGYLHESVTYIKQDISDNNPNSKYFDLKIPVDTSNNSITYTPYTVQRGDSIWSIAEKIGMPDYELAAANNMTRTQMLYVGQVISVPVHNVPVKETVDPQYGEVLDWFSEAQYVFPVGAVGKLVDIETGKSFMIKRTMGANHSDTETLTIDDSNTMKSIFGGWNWN